jgi:amino acid transporter
MTETNAASHKHLVRGIGFIGLAILVLNSMIGAGIFALPAAVSARAGVLSPWLFLAVGLLIITVVLTFAELASYFKSSGGPVLFTTTAFGPLAGFATGWLLFVSRMAAFAANTTVMAVYLGAIWPWFSEGIGRALLIILVCASLTYANYVGVKEGVRTMGVITFFKITPILLLIVLGLQHVSGDTLFPATMPTIDDLGGTTLLLVYAFVGFESVTIVSGESKDPKRGLPRALVMTVIATGLLYFLIVLAYISVLPDAGTNGATLIDVGRELMGPVGTVLITFAAFFSIGGNLSSIMLAVPRLTFALAHERLLPKWFGNIHDKYSTPDNSILFLGGLLVHLVTTGNPAQGNGRGKGRGVPSEGWQFDSGFRADPVYLDGRPGVSAFVAGYGRARCFRAGVVCGLRQAPCALGSTGRSGLVCLTGRTWSFGLKYIGNNQPRSKGQERGKHHESSAFLSRLACSCSSRVIIRWSGIRLSFAGPDPGHIEHQRGHGRRRRCRAGKSRGAGTRRFFARQSVAHRQRGL